MGFRNAAPLARLEKILEDKHALDALSATRLKSIRAGFKLGEQTRQLAAIVLEALPVMRAEADLQRAQIDALVSDSLVDAQKRTQRSREIERARSSLDLVSARLMQEFSSPSLINQDQLEESLVQEASMRSHLDALSTQIGRRIASEKVNANAAHHTRQLPSIAPESRPAPVMRAPVNTYGVDWAVAPRKRSSGKSVQVVFNNTIASEDGSDLASAPFAKIVAFLMLACIATLVVLSV